MRLIVDCNGHVKKACHISCCVVQHRTTGDEPPGEGWLAIPTEGEGLIKEVRERTVHSKEEKTDLTETEDVQQLGDLSDKVRHQYSSLWVSGLNREFPSNFFFLNSCFLYENPSVLQKHQEI